MKRFLFAAAVLLATTAGGAFADIGVSVSIGQPGFYGRLDIGDFPPPVLVYPQPLMIQRARPGISYQPIYLRVPPGHAGNWGRHCHRYNACGRPVYFVQDTWYHDVYAPRYRELRRHPQHRHDQRHRVDHDRRGDRGYAPGYPPGPRPGHVPGYGPGYGPGHAPGYPPGRP